MSDSNQDLTTPTDPRNAPGSLAVETSDTDPVNSNPEDMDVRADDSPAVDIREELLRKVEADRERRRQAELAAQAEDERAAGS